MRKSCLKGDLHLQESFDFATENMMESESGGKIKGLGGKSLFDELQESFKSECRTFLDMSGLNEVIANHLELSMFLAYMQGVEYGRRNPEKPENQP